MIIFEKKYKKFRIKAISSDERITSEGQG